MALPFDPEKVVQDAIKRASRPPIIEDQSRPTIEVVAGQRHVAADQAIDAMVQNGTAFYQRSSSLVRVTSTKAKTADGAIIETPAITPVTAPILGRAMGQAAEWERMTTKNGLIRIDPPKEVVEQVAAMSGEWPFPPIAGVIGTPTMRPDGTILDRVGYDIATGLVLVGPPRMPRIPDRPARQDADRALEVLQSLLAEFPFVDDASRAVALSMILTVVLRGALLPAVPMHAATAPQPGTGKSYLADIASVIGTGERCAVIAMSPDVNETEKRLIAAALSGQQIIAIDNVSEIMAGDFLNQVTERPLLKIRPLGTSTDIRIPNTFTLFANGNNLSAPADMVRRTLLCQLDANVENPEARQFAGNPVADVMANRGHYVAAALTIGRAYVCAGYPDQLPPLASFERWSNLVRSALAWLGAGDPCKSMDMARAEDPIRAARAAVFAGWAKELGLNPGGLTVPQMIQEADAFDGTGFQCPTFREAVLGVAAERSGTAISPKRFGKWLASNNNNVIGGFKLTANRSDPSRVRWMLTKQ
jgi:putative DNA primase/helicase